MKKLLLGLIFISLIGCKVLEIGDQYKLISVVNNQVELGMTKAEFLALAGERAEKDAMSADYYVYRVNQYSYTELLGDHVVDSMFYYFDRETDTLFKVDAGVKQ